MRILTFKSSLIFLFSLLLLACSKNRVEPEVETPVKLESYFEYTVSGAETSSVKGTPKYSICTSGFLCNLDFSSESETLILSGNKRYHEEGSETYTVGVPLEHYDDGTSLITKGTYAITEPTTLSPTDEGYYDFTFSVKYNKGNTAYGESPGTTGSLVITIVEQEFFEGTFEVEASLSSPAAVTTVTIKGKFSQMLKEASLLFHDLKIPPIAAVRQFKNN